jgi:hypothetical protein
VERRDPLYWEYGHEQAVRLQGHWVYRPHPREGIQVYDADGDPREERDLAEQKSALVAAAEDIFASEHVPSLYFPSPGETREEWIARLEEADAELCDNVNT